MEYDVIENSGEIFAERRFKFGEGRSFTVKADGRDLLCVEVNPDEWNPFGEWVIWHDHFCLGTGSEMIAVNLRSFEYRRIEVDMYFGYFYQYGEMLFTASAAGVLAFDKNMELLWRNEDLAVDGVTFSGVVGSELYVSCEMDPPGGWVAKRLDIYTGNEI